MGLDIGIISITYLERPHGKAYKFAWELATEANIWGYMGGEGNCWGPFTKTQIRRMLRRFAREKGLSQDEEEEVWAWVESLPWEGNDIELHFNW